MKQLRLLSVILIAAVCAVLTLSGCNTILYPDVEDIDEVFAQIAEIEAFECDIFITTVGVAESGATMEKYESFSLKAFNLLEGTKVFYAYNIKDASQKVFSIGTQNFMYYDGELVTNLPDKLFRLNPFTVGFNQLNYTLSDPAINRTVFEASFDEIATLILAHQLDAEDFINNITEATIVIEADNETNLPVSIAFNLTGVVSHTFTLPIVSVQDFEVSVQIKYVFKKINQPVTLNYPDEVLNYIQTNHPELLEQDDTSEETE